MIAVAAGRLARVVRLSSDTLKGFWPDIVLGGEAYLRHALVTLSFFGILCLHLQCIFGLRSEYMMLL